MELQSAHHQRLIVFLYEFFGTAFLLYAINIQTTSNVGQFGIAFMLFAFLLIGGGNTGAHYNPAVSLGVWLSSRHHCEDLFLFLFMMLAQFAGAYAGVTVAYFSLLDATNDIRDCDGEYITVDEDCMTPADIYINYIAQLAPAPGINIGNVFLIEALCTGVFVMVNLIVKTKVTSPSDVGFHGAVAVALTLMAMITCAMTKTGAALNPAVGLAQITVQCFMLDDYSDWQYVWAYTLGPWSGAVLAWAMQFLHIHGTHAIHHPTNDHVLVENGRAINPPRLMGDGEIAKEMTEKAEIANRAVVIE